MADKQIKLQLCNLSKSFVNKQGKPFQSVDNISLDIYDNEFVVLLGPGQCGKTVIMNMIEGLETPTSGEIKVDGEVITGSAPRIGMVFQTTSLMPWKTVMENVELGLKFAGVAKDERQKIAQENIELVGLAGFEKSYPSQLSGGMKQRVGIARAYTFNPQILLMDEPFGALDAQTRYAMQDEISKIWEHKKRTIIFVTNNIEEACYLGDRIVLFSECPARIKKIYTNMLPRPRDQMSHEFICFRQEISDNTDLAL